MRDLPALMPYLHLPVQSGSDRDPRGDEPQAHRRRVPPADRPRPRGPARHRPVVGLHRRLPRRDRRRFRRHDAARAPRSASRAPSRSSTARAPARRPPSAPTQVPEAVKAERLARAAGAARHASATPSTRRPSGRRRRRSGREGRAGIRARSRARRRICSRAVRRTDRHRSATVVPVRIVRAGTNSLFGEAGHRGGGGPASTAHDARMTASERQSDGGVDRARRAARAGARRALPSRRRSRRPRSSLTFDDNRLASLVFGQYDQNVAHLERRLGVTATAHGNHVVVKGSPEAAETRPAGAREALRPGAARAAAP